MPNIVSTDLPGGRSEIDTWKYTSKSSGDLHTVTLWTGGYLSCSCKGWIIKKEATREKFGQDRWCKHIGEAWSEAELTYLASTGGKPAKPDDPRGREYNVPDPFAQKRLERPKPEPESRVLAKTENISLRPTRAFDV